MKDRRQSYWGILFSTSFIIILIVTGCNKDKSPEVDRASINYSFKWSEVLVGRPVPKRLSYCFYSLENGSMLQFESDSSGLKTSLPPDKYKLLIYNCDVSHIEFRDMDKFETAKACILASKATQRTGGGVDPLYGVAIEELIVKQGKETPAEFTPTPLVREVNLHIKVQGANYITSCKGSLSGVAASLSLSRQEVIPDNPATVHFEATPSAEGASANVMILGKPFKKEEGGGEPPVELPKNEVVLDFTLKDGSTVSSTIDLGDSINNTEGGDIQVDVEATVEQGPVFSITITHWEVASGDSLTIE